MRIIIRKMIKSWKHKGIRQFYTVGSTAGVQSNHSRRLKILLQLLNAATCPEDMNLPGFSFHPLKGNKKEYFAVTVNKNWRIIFKFEGEDAILVDYLDYH
jgi:proteic killer suppression protein